MLGGIRIIARSWRVSTSKSVPKAFRHRALMRFWNLGLTLF